MSEFLQKLRDSWPPDRWSDVTVLIAVSGGADSIALLRGLSQLRVASGGRLVAAHFNHQLRGSESDADQAFVVEVAREVGVELILGTATNDLAANHGGQGLEGAARQSRYEFLASAAGQCGARYVATAHTADDQVETILHHILRGTGLAGLAGIPRTRQLTEAATLIRPLLDVTRGEVLDYLQLLGKSYREDSTNRLLKQTRNRIRHELLPLLERDYSPHVRAALLRLGRVAEEADDWLSGQAWRLSRDIARPIPDGVEIYTKSLCHAPSELFGRYVLIGIWQEQSWPRSDMSFDKWEQLYSLACTDDAGRTPLVQMFPGGIRAEKQGGILRLTRPG
ncbi:MAG TPA: tRNA lysidine(34) synthetase TilS [Pirellulaceae bacterium]|nr:tRNA lysidine(34) synthetase TilS [Pirellulaceae bacterium]